MESITEVKKEWLLSSLVAKFSNADALTKKELESDAKTKRHRLTLCKIDRESIAKNRLNLVDFASEELNEIFTVLWTALGPHIHNEVLSEHGYLLLKNNIQRALVDENISDEEANENAKIEYLADIETYKTLDQTAFFHIMLDLIEVWAGMLNPRYYAAFAWALLASLIDISRFPPKFKAKHNIKCIIYVDSETDILMKFSSEKDIRTNIKIKNEWLNSMHMRSEVQERLNNRRDANRLSIKSFHILTDILSMQKITPNQAIEDDDDEDDDDDLEEGDGTLPSNDGESKSKKILSRGSSTSSLSRQRSLQNMSVGSGTEGIKKKKVHESRIWRNPGVSSTRFSGYEYMHERDGEDDRSLSSHGSIGRKSGTVNEHRSMTSFYSNEDSHNSGECGKDPMSQVSRTSESIFSVGISRTSKSVQNVVGGSRASESMRSVGESAALESVYNGAEFCNGQSFDDSKFINVRHTPQNTKRVPTVHGVPSDMCTNIIFDRNTPEAIHYANSSHLAKYAPPWNPKHCPVKHRVYAASNGCKNDSRDSNDLGDTDSEQRLQLRNVLRRSDGNDTKKNVARGSAFNAAKERCQRKKEYDDNAKAIKSLLTPSHKKATSPDASTVETIKELLYQEMSRNISPHFVSENSTSKLHIVQSSSATSSPHMSMREGSSLLFNLTTTSQILRDYMDPNGDISQSTVISNVDFNDPSLHDNNDMEKNINSFFMTSTPYVHNTIEAVNNDTITSSNENQNISTEKNKNISKYTSIVIETNHPNNFYLDDSINTSLTVTKNNFLPLKIRMKSPPSALRSDAESLVKSHSVGQLEEDGYVRTLVRPLTSHSQNNNRKKISSKFIESDLYSKYYNGVKPGPWIPSNGYQTMISDKKDLLLNWEERKILKELSPYDTTMYKTVVKRQEYVRNSFQNCFKQTTK